MGNYIATVMDRHYLGDTLLAFSCSYAVTGTYDEEKDVFTDRNGNHYYRMGSYETLNGKVPHAFFNLMKLTELEEYVDNNISINTAIKQYEELCKERIHFVGLTEDAETFYTVLNTNILYQLSHNFTNYEDDKYDEESSFNEDIDDIIASIVEGKFSLEQLKSMKEQFTSNCESIESVVDAIKEQLRTLGEEDDDIKIYREKKKAVESQKKKEKTAKEEKPNYINIDDLFNKVTKTLIAQDEPARRVITEIARKELDDRKKREGILLTGPTGVGKTELMKLIAKYLDRPFHKINSTKLTSPGYVGKDVEEELWELYVKCGKNKQKAERAIIFFDEIDKKGSRRKDDVAGRGVLNVLLPFIEGSTYDACADMKTVNPGKKVKIDTKNMIVILGGAYTDVYKNLLEKNVAGFNAEKSSKPKYRPATTKDFIDNGMMTDEFMGRVTVIKLNDLDVDDIKRVLLESDESAIKIQEEIFKKLGVKLTFTDGFATEVAKRAEKKKTGARGLNGIIDEATWKAFADVHTHRGEYEEVILDENTVEDASNYQLVKKKQNL